MSSETPPSSTSPSEGSPKRSRSALLVGILVWLVILSPIGVYLVDFWGFGRMQHNDYYAILGDMIRAGENGLDGQLTADPLHWLSLKSNEHRASLPLVVYALNIFLTDGHNLGLTFFALLLLTIQLVILVSALPAEIRERPWAKTVFGLGLALFCYTPVAAHNVAMGFSGTIWFFANVLAVAAICSLTRRAGHGPAWAVWPVLALGIAAAFSHSTHLVLWPVVIAGAVFLRVSWPRLALLAGGMAFVVALFALSYESLPYHPEMQTRHPKFLLRYAAVYLGSMFSGELVPARTIGLIAMTASGLIVAGCAAASFRSKPLRTALAPWLMIQLYGVGNAFIAAVGRSGFGEMQAMSSRYGSLSALFWIGLLTSMGVLIWRYLPGPIARRRVAGAALLVTVIGLVMAMHVRGGPIVERFVERGNRQQVAALAVAYGVPDREIIEKTVAPWPEHVWIRRSYLERTGHVPFDRSWPMQLGTRIVTDRIVPELPSGVVGHVDRETEITDTFLRLGGWVYGPELEVAEVLVVDPEGTICGELITGIYREDVATVYGQLALESGWEGYLAKNAKGTTPGDEVWIVVRFEGDPAYYRLPWIIPAIQLGLPAPEDSETPAEDGSSTGA